MKFVIFDTEYTTWKNAQENRWLGEGEFKEIIQIGALLVDFPRLTVLDELILTIRPKINPVLSEYCKRLLGVSQEEIDNGITFQEALQHFLDFCGQHLVVSYGNDLGVIAENLILTKSDPLNLYGKNSPSFVNIRYWIFSFDHELKGVVSGKLWEKVSSVACKKFVREHNSISDCYSILQMLRYLQKKHYNLPFS